MQTARRLHRDWLTLCVVWLTAGQTVAACAGNDPNCNEANNCIDPSTSSSTSTATGGGSTATSTGTGSGGNATGGGSSVGGGPAGGFADIIDEATWDQMFLHDDDPACTSGGLFSYQAILDALADYPTFCTEGSLDDRKREAAAFLANISHETTGGWPTAPDGPQAWGLCFQEEVGCEGGGCTGYCDPSNVQFPCAPGVTYHGRGPMQLSWNYNYGQAGEALSLPLLENPDMVTADGVVAFKTALWFWMTPQAPKPSCHDVISNQWTPSAQDEALGRLPGLGMTINIINGGLECGQSSTPSNAQDRIDFYLRYCTMLNVDPGLNLDCDNMTPY